MDAEIFLDAGVDVREVTGFCKREVIVFGWCSKDELSVDLDLERDVVAWGVKDMIRYGGETCRATLGFSIPRGLPLNESTQIDAARGSMPSNNVEEMENPTA